MADDWVRERAIRLLTQEQMNYNPTLLGAVRTALQEAVERGEQSILARLRSPDEAMVEAVCVAAWPAWDEGSQKSKDVIRDETRTTIRALADALDQDG